MSAFEATVRQTDKAVIIDLRGLIDGGAEQALNAAYAEATATNPASVPSSEIAPVVPGGTECRVVIRIADHSAWVPNQYIDSMA